MLRFNRFWLQNLPSDSKSYRAFRETAGPQGANSFTKQTDQVQGKGYDERTQVEKNFSFTVSLLPWYKYALIKYHLKITHEL